MPQRQPRVPGGRRPYHIGADAQIERAIERECERYDITRALVIRNALAFTFNIDLYAYESKPVKLRRVK